MKYTPMDRVIYHDRRYNWHNFNSRKSRQRLPGKRTAL